MGCLGLMTGGGVVDVRGLAALVRTTWRALALNVMGGRLACLDGCTPDGPGTGSLFSMAECGGSDLCCFSYNNCV